MQTEQTALNKHPEETRPKKHRRGVVILLLVLILALLAAAVFLSMRKPVRPKVSASGLRYETNVTIGDLPGKTPQERVAELNEIVAEGMVSISINSTPCTGTAEDDKSQVNWLIENPSNQGKLIRVEVTRDDTGEMVYQTGAIKPGSYVETAPLDVPLPKGSYTCTAMFFTYKLDTEEYIGKAGAQIILTVS